LPCYLHTGGVTIRLTMKDTIIEELHRIRQTHAAKFNYDVDAIVRDAAKRDRAEKRKVYSLRRGKLVEVKP
jgi:hypothetical protein